MPCPRFVKYHEAHVQRYLSRLKAFPPRCAAARGARRGERGRCARVCSGVCRWRVSWQVTAVKLQCCVQIGGPTLILTNLIPAQMAPVEVLCCGQVVGAQREAAAGAARVRAHDHHARGWLHDALPLRGGHLAAGGAGGAVWRRGAHLRPGARGGAGWWAVQGHSWSDLEPGGKPERAQPVRGQPGLSARLARGTCRMRPAWQPQACARAPASAGRSAQVMCGAAPDRGRESAAS